jgi:hypothetical protein
MSVARSHSWHPNRDVCVTRSHSWHPNSDMSVTRSQSRHPNRDTSVTRSHSWRPNRDMRVTRSHLWHFSTTVVRLSRGSSYRLFARCKLLAAVDSNIQKQSIRWFTNALLTVCVSVLLCRRQLFYFQHVTQSPCVRSMYILSLAMASNCGTNDFNS